MIWVLLEVYKPKVRHNKFISNGRHWSKYPRNEKPVECRPSKKPRAMPCLEVLLANTRPQGQGHMKSNKSTPKDTAARNEKNLISLLSSKLLNVSTYPFLEASQITFILFPPDLPNQKWLQRTQDGASVAKRSLELKAWSGCASQSKHLHFFPTVPGGFLSFL